MFFKQIKKIRFSPEEISELVERWQKQADCRARNLLAQSFIGLVISEAVALRRYQIPTEDLIQEGMFGLLRAIDKFDVNRGFKFSTYACHWIKSKMCRSVLRDQSLMKIGNGPEYVKIFYNLRHLEQMLGDDIEDSEKVAEIIGGNKDKIESIMPLMRHAHISFDSSDPDDGRSTEDLISFAVASTKDREGESISLLLQSGEIGKAIQGLRPREKKVIEDHYFNNKTLNEIGAELGGLSRERVRQLETRALKKLRSFLSDLDDHPPPPPTPKKPETETRGRPRKSEEEKEKALLAAKEKQEKKKETAKRERSEKEKRRPQEEKLKRRIALKAFFKK